MPRLRNREGETSRLLRRWVIALGGLTGLGAIATALFSPPTVQVNLSNIGSNNGSNNVDGSKSVAVSQSVSTHSQPAGQSAPRVAPHPRAPALSDYEKYIDPHAPRVAGATNVAIALRGLPGSPVAPLEDAIQRALRERGFGIVDIFREQFRRDGLELQLFNGDASLASRLKLQQHCDSVLLGVLRFVGPAQLVGDGLYIREAVLDVHAVDPLSGRVVRSLEIREKGGGANAELSTVNALNRLEETVQANLGEWSWT